MSTSDGWRDGALCAQVDPELFFPELGGSTRQAKSVCAACPVRAACLDYAMQHPVDGVWGGTSVLDRRSLAAAAGRTYNTRLSPSTAGPQPVVCGTGAQAKRHRRASETCEVCRVLSVRGAA